MGRKELRFRWNHSHALVAAFIEVQASPNFDRTLALLIKDANREAQPSIGQDHRFTRRQAVTAIGTVGLGSFLAACTSNSTATTASSTTPSTGPTTTAGTGATTTTTAGAVLDCVLGNY